MAWDDGLTEAEKDAIVARYYDSERARKRAEWEADGCWEHDCDPLDMYAGGCSICGKLITSGSEQP